MAATLTQREPTWTETHGRRLCGDTSGDPVLQLRPRSTRDSHRPQSLQEARMDPRSPGTWARVTGAGSPNLPLGLMEHPGAPTGKSSAPGGSQGHTCSPFRQQGADPWSGPQAGWVLRKEQDGARTQLLKERSRASEAWSTAALGRRPSIPPTGSREKKGWARGCKYRSPSRAWLHSSHASAPFRCQQTGPTGILGLG